MKRRPVFFRFARRLSIMAGKSGTFFLSLAFVGAWALTGPLFGYSDSWQLVINTATTIITFLMVFLIQNSQNRDTEAIQIKLDEIIRSIEAAHNALLDLEELSDEEIEAFRRRYAQLARAARGEIKKGLLDTGSPDVRMN